MRLNVTARRLASALAAVTACLALALSPTAARGVETWSPPATLSVDGVNGTTDGAMVTATSAGVVVATWAHFTGSNYTVQVAVSRDDGITWGATETLSDPSGHAEAPRVVSNESGAVVVYWNADVNSVWEVHASSSTDGGATWSGYAPISDVNYSSQSANMVAHGEHGFAVTFEENNGSFYNVVSRVSSDDGSSWSAPVVVSDGVSNSFFAQISLSGDVLVISWYTTGSVSYDLFASTSTDGGTSWLPPSSIVTGENISTDYSLVSSTDDEFALIWLRNDGASSTLMSASSTSGATSWTSATTIESGVINSPFFTVNSDETSIAVAWADNDGVTSRIVMSQSTDGGATWAPAQIVTSTPSVIVTSYWRISVVTAPSGRLTLTWTKLSGDISGDGNVVQVTSSTDGGATWSPLAEPGGANSSYSRMTTTRTGQTVLTWVVFTGGDVPVQASATYSPTLPNTGTDASLLLSIGALGMAVLLSGFAAVAWGRLRESNSRPIHYE